MINVFVSFIHEAFSFNRNFFVHFILLSFVWKISGASLLENETSQNKLNAIDKKEHRVLIQKFPFNYTVSRNPSREKLELKNDEKVIGGQEAEPHEFPHILAMYLYRRGEGYQFACGASIINNNFALTAAHCLEAERPETVQVIAGEHDRSKKEGTEVARNISQIIIHEDYDGLNNDIAIIRFSKPFKYNDNIEPIQMATRNRNTTGDVVVSGWGDTSFPGDTSLILKKGQVKVVPIEECQEVRPVNALITDKQICAGTKTGKPDACYGDSGGPLMQKARRGINHVLVGIVSYGTPCAKPNRPTIYTRVAKYRDWIDPKIVV